jgi:hypothetical protein
VPVRLRAICDKLETALGDFQVPLLAAFGNPAKVDYYRLCGICSIGRTVGYPLLVRYNKYALLAILICLLIFISPIMIYFIIFLILPNKDSYINELFKQYGNLQSVKVIQTFIRKMIIRLLLELAEHAHANP